MAKQRIINTRFWIDDYISNLDPIEKLLFLYLLTNPSTDICGVYEIPLKIIAVETGIDKEMVIKILDRFKKNNKVVYHKGWVGIKNFTKYQSLNPKVRKGIEIGLNKAPKELIDSLSIDNDSLSHSNLNSNSNSNSKILSADADEKVPNTLKEKKEEEIVPTEFSFQEYLEEMRKNKQRHINIIALYWSIKGYTHENLETCQSAIRRDLRPARALVGYTDERLAECMHWHEGNADYDWKLETIHKNIDSFLKDNK